MTADLVLAFDTATEHLAVAVGRLAAGGAIEQVAAVDEEAPRRANSALLGKVSGLLGSAGLSLDEVACVVVGRGPGSFTGVRIGVATAKGLAEGLGVGLYGVSTLAAVAHTCAGAGVEGLVGVVGDAMRGEVYPALFRLEAGAVHRLSEDRVARPDEVAAAWAADIDEPLVLAGNGLRKHGGAFVEALGSRAALLAEDLWVPSAAGLLAAFGDAATNGELGDGDPGALLPIYTRLSDAEEAERERGGEPAATPESGVAGTETAGHFAVRPMAVEDVDAVMAIEESTFTDSWTAGIFRDELEAPRRAWLVAVDEAGVVAGYGGVAALADEAHVMNLAVREDLRGRGVGRLLLERLKERAVSLGTSMVTLEVRRTNEPAISLYRSCGMEVAGARPGYYSDTGEDALIMWGALASPVPRVASAPACFAALKRDDADTLVLAIESSCDETAASVMRGSGELLSNVVASQIDFHARFGGVVPEIASRKHTEAIVGVVEEAMTRAGAALGCPGPVPFADLDAIAVTHGPGLVGALVVGVAYAKGLAMAAKRPLVGVNHLEGHIFANVLADPAVAPPLVALVVSGGHTSLVHMPEWGVYRTLGETLDDAAGEAFDKVAKVLGLGYPGGPILSKMAAEGDPTAIDFPRAMLRSGDFRFSLSGLKTAVINHIRHEQEAGRTIDVPDLAASFQAAVVDVQVAKAVRAVEETGATSFCLAGGVAANPSLREALRAAIEPLGVHVSVPPLHLCTDNAAMIAAAAHYRFLRGERLGLDAEAVPGLRLDTPEI